MRRYIDQNQPVSLYLHVPFCSSKCSYCAFYSEPSSCWTEKMLDEYTDILVRQISGILEEVENPFYTIFLGGGNPAMLGPERLIRILNTAEKKGMPEEVTLEMNPEQVSLPFLEALSPFVSRISVGIQSIDEECLRILGRNSSIARNLEALKILSESGISFNADLITGVPGVDVETTLEDIRVVSSYHPGHISFYCLCYEQDTPIMELAPLRSEEKELESLRKGWQLLRKLGYEHYEISNFALDGCYARHNLVYWHLGQYIGLGPQAESSLGYDSICSVRCNNNLEEFLGHPSLDFEPLKKSEAALEYLMVGLRTIWGIDKREMKKRFDLDFDLAFSEAVGTLEKSWYEEDDEVFRLTEEGFLLLDRIIFTLWSSY